MNDVVIKFESVSKYYPLYHHIVGGFKSFLFNMPSAIKQIKNSKHWVLKDISFEVKRGESFGVIGKNGAGKSTMLGLIAGVLQPNNGSITINGRISPLLGLGAGFHNDLPGADNIILNGILLGLTKKTVLKKLKEIIEFSDIGDMIYEPVKTYSTGMRARLGFSVVAHLDPEILLIDEILAVGDIDFKSKCIDKINEFRRQNITIVLVSHNMADIKKICDKTMWISSQRIHLIGKAEDVASSYVKHYSGNKK